MKIIRMGFALGLLAMATVGSAIAGGPTDRGIDREIKDRIAVYPDPGEERTGRYTIRAKDQANVELQMQKFTICSAGLESRSRWQPVDRQDAERYLRNCMRGLPAGYRSD